MALSSEEPFPTGSPTQNTVAVMFVCRGYLLPVLFGVGVTVGVAIGVAVRVAVGMTVAVRVADAATTVKLAVADSRPAWTDGIPAALPDHSSRPAALGL